MKTKRCSCPALDDALRLSALTLQKRALTCLLRYGHLEKSTRDDREILRCCADVVIVSLFKIFSIDCSLYLYLFVFCFFLFCSQVPSAAAVVTRLHRTARNQRVQVLCCRQTLDEHTGKEFLLSLLSCNLCKKKKKHICVHFQLFLFHSATVYLPVSSIHYVLYAHACLTLTQNVAQKHFWPLFNIVTRSSNHISCFSVRERYNCNLLYTLCHCMCRLCVILCPITDVRYCR